MPTREQMLAAFRERHGPSPRAVQRIQARVRELGPPPARVDSPIPLPPRRRQAVFALVGLAAAAALAVWIGSHGPSWVSRDEAVDAALAGDAVETGPGQAAKVEPAPARTPKTAPKPRPSAVVPTPTPPPPEEVEPEVEAPTKPARRVRRPVEEAEPRPAPKPEPEVEDVPVKPQVAADTLAEEIVLVQRARAALSAGHAQASLKLLKTHQDRFASGSLTEEASAVRTMASCRLTPEKADELRAAFRHRHPRSLFRAQVEGICTIDED